jgi:hypothetical protein
LTRFLVHREHAEVLSARISCTLKLWYGRWHCMKYTLYFVKRAGAGDGNGDAT